MEGASVRHRAAGAGRRAPAGRQTTRKPTPRGSLKRFNHTSETSYSATVGVRRSCSQQSSVPSASCTCVPAPVVPRSFRGGPQPSPPQVQRPPPSARCPPERSVTRGHPPPQVSGPPVRARAGAREGGGQRERWRKEGAVDRRRKRWTERQPDRGRGREGGCGTPHRELGRGGGRGGGAV